MSSATDPRGGGYPSNTPHARCVGSFSCFAPFGQFAKVGLCRYPTNACVWRTSGGGWGRERMVPRYVLMVVRCRVLELRSGVDTTRCVYLVDDQWGGRRFPFSLSSFSFAFQKLRCSLIFEVEHEQHCWCDIAEDALRVLRHRTQETPTVGLEPTTTRLRALRSAD